MNKAIFFMMAFILAASLVLAQGAQKGLDDSSEDLEVEDLEDSDGMEDKSSDELELEDELESENETELEQEREMEQEENKLKIKEKVKLKLDGEEVESEFEYEEETEGNETKVKVKLSNGFKEIKVMPSTASARALEVLGAKCAERNCSIELKEVGSGNETKAVYEIKTEKEAKILGLFKAKMKVEAQVDAENGEVIKQKKAWWAFLASESDESEETSETESEGSPETMPALNGSVAPEIVSEEIQA